MHDDLSFEDIKRQYLARPSIPGSVVRDVKEVERLLNCEYITREQAEKYLEKIEENFRKLQEVMTPPDTLGVIVMDEAVEFSAVEWEKMKRWWEERSRMSESQWKQEMYGDWIGPTEDEIALSKIAEEYHTRCDAYDRRVCSGISPRSGEPMPVDGREQGLIDKNALSVLEELVRKNYQFSREQIRNAIKRYVK